LRSKGVIKIVSVEKMRQIEADSDASVMGYDALMQAAGTALARRVLEILAPIPDPRVTLLIGPGNNGGDGLVAGRVIAQESKALVRFYLLKKRDENDPNLKAVRELGLLVADAEDDQRYRVLRNMVGSAHVVIDALYGIGLKLPLRDDAAKLLKNVHQALHEQPELPETITLTPDAPNRSFRPTAPYVIAVDCPSGLDCDTGELDDNAIPADETIAFIGAKPGLLNFPGAEAVGQLRVVSFSPLEDLKALQDEPWSLVDDTLVRDLLPARTANSHKGTFGKAMIVGGSANYVGAPGLSARAAYRIGAGLVTVGAPGQIVTSLAGHIPEATWLILPQEMGVISEAATNIVRKELATYTALLIGPGMGHEDSTRQMLTKLLDKSGGKSQTRKTIGFAVGAANSQQEAAETFSLPPLVIDADGLNILAAIENWPEHLPDNTIITPHPGEMARLANVDTQTVQANRLEIASAKAAAWKVILVLKGAHTIIAAPDGRLAVLPFKTPALASAGTGDVLAGTITGLLAQGLSPFEAAVAGGYLHGLAGQQAAEQLGGVQGVIASDVLNALPLIVNQIRQARGLAVQS
jgi:ADP-dependent NAD(P)H-hydrate dehydratase / NAD(P)H-hydrate epimerase